ncbi:MAG: hypothetical protein WCA00_14825 [Candidatus Acidiferrales bacterium]
MKTDPSVALLARDADARRIGIIADGFTGRNGCNILVRVAIRNWFGLYFHGVTADFECGVVAIRKHVGRELCPAKTSGRQTARWVVRDAKAAVHPTRSAQRATGDRKSAIRGAQSARKLAIDLLRGSLFCVSYDDF